MAPHSSTLAWKIPWMEEAAVHGVGKSRTRLSNFTFIFYFHALEKEMATHSSVLARRIPGTGGAWWAAVYGVAQSQTRLKRLSSSSSHPGIPHASQVDTKDLPSHRPIGMNKSGSFFSVLTYLPTLSIQD